MVYVEKEILGVKEGDKYLKYMALLRVNG